MDELNYQWGHGIFKRLAANMEIVIKGQKECIRYILAGLASSGHILLEDNPGTGKTTLAKALAKSIDVDFKRIQFTPDLLPSDILGVSIFDPSQKLFKFHNGPVFTNILLADEINRASPRTQSALLESMAEGQVSIDGTILNLEKMFFVIATQNPVESSGTYPLPEAQMDRFAMQLKLGYVAREQEVAILSEQQEKHPIHTLSPCVTLKEILDLRFMVNQVFIAKELKLYMVDIVNKTREQIGISLGASPRATIALMKTAQALAVFDNQSFITSDHIQEIAVSVIAHRLVLDPQSSFSGVTPKSVVEDILRSIPVPV
ncbi:MAG: MoxR family ATPase [Desulfobacula sp.]|jgi:MoxR-like ATPase|uniref:AAA family ATPase n=1 Tax=Desulfobacula sp. TaxID=2593537 RepID=UPI001DA0A81F|nr:MoxR family ATPase [Desulfobacula sp.]MBT3485363.1 MoxR family ATPase [Desulfobacula sp.]MBT3803785.1 MoxR family ATPase [Desulfobacula sp.]MBT4026619.1 MoxR family ATPase [Desulfobacula sp.]MBT4200530.1 MoxR family ATPase [Desulfobacula sp.]